MGTKNNLTHGRTCVYNINYHIVWSVKYRRKVISKDIEQFLQQTALTIGKEKGFIVHMLEAGEMDHVHCFVSAPPTLSISNIVKYLKGITGRQLFKHFPFLRTKLWKGQLWNHSYYVETVGSVSEEVIRKYIAAQDKHY